MRSSTCSSGRPHCNQDPNPRGKGVPRIKAAFDNVTLRPNFMSPWPYNTTSRMVQGIKMSAILDLTDLYRGSILHTNRRVRVSIFRFRACMNEYIFFNNLKRTRMESNGLWNTLVLENIFSERINNIKCHKDSKPNAKPDARDKRWWRGTWLYHVIRFLSYASLALLRYLSY